MQSMAQIQANQARNPPSPPKTPPSPSRQSFQPRIGGGACEDFEDHRTLFLFSRSGYPVSEAEIREFFVKSYGNMCQQIDSLHMLDEECGATIVFHSEFAVQWIFRDTGYLKFRINGKIVSAFPLPHYSSQPRYGCGGRWANLPADRTLPVLFFSGCPVSEAEIREFIAKWYGNICQIEALFMMSNEEYALIVFSSESAVQRILRDSGRVKFRINGKNVLAMPFGQKTPSYPLYQSSYYPRVGVEGYVYVPDERSLLLRFSSGHTLSEEEIREFFAMPYEIESVFSSDDEYAEIKFYSESAVQWILGNEYRVKLSIKGKDVLAVRYGSKPPLSPSHLSSQPRFGGVACEALPDDRTLFLTVRRGYPAVSEAEIRDFFANLYASTILQIESVIAWNEVHTSIVFCSESAVHWIFRYADLKPVEFSINGKDVMAAVFGPKTPPSPTIRLLLSQGSAAK